jgi:3-hydroxyisobutyrate dehydrogenase-like beta-hydroxyacid dehydrogenase
MAENLVEVDSVTGCDVVISICPPSAAREVADGVVGFAGHFVDANAISPAHAREIAAIVTAAGATYVDGSIIGPPPRRSGTTRMYLSGEGADSVARLFEGGRLEARTLPDGGDVAASALKMAYASWTKITAALLLGSVDLAENLGVSGALYEEWALSQPRLASELVSARESAASKGWRWEGEMREIADTFDAAGGPSGFAAAAAEIYANYPAPDRQA